MSTPLQFIRSYLCKIGGIRATGSGTDETSYYPALENVLNAIGKTLKPKVSCVMQLRNRGAGMPDGGFFTADQIRRSRRLADSASLFEALPPARGVLEAKAPSRDLESIVQSEQVARYLGRYGLILVTNYRAFALVGRSASGAALRLESFELAPDEVAFWELCNHSASASQATCNRFAEFLHRALLANAPLTAPQDVAALLASYARDARARLDAEELPALATLRSALENALGLRFEGEKGEHFFRSTLVQTLFYGVFSAWVLWARRRPPPATVRRSPDRHSSNDTADATQESGVPSRPATVRRSPDRQSSDNTADATRESGVPLEPFVHEAGEYYRSDATIFDWRTAIWNLRVPMISALFQQIAAPARLGQLGLEEILNWAGAALNRIDRAAFFAAFDEGHAVQYFYEPFLEAFDPELRKEFGVWYTPEEIVRYQVERVDRALRDELSIPDGLADPRVVVLDPCCGTGAYLREVLRRIAATLHEKGGDALVANDLKQAAMQRVLGFEIMPAPFVVAHLQLGLELESLGAPLDDNYAERIGIYLTNALTGWEPPKEPKVSLLFPEMEQERDAADHIKRSDSILVVLGNPPYYGFAGIAVDEERDLSTAYRAIRHAPSPQGQGLNDLYIRFFRMAERRVVEMNPGGGGVISFISNYSWLDGLSFPGMRERYLEAFDRIVIDCLNGDKYKTGKLTPEGDSDPSAFSTEFNREGIQVGTAIATLVKKSGTGSLPVNHAQSKGSGTSSLPVNHGRAAHATISFRHFWGKNKRADLLADRIPYQEISPILDLGYPFIPLQTATGYTAWPSLPELLPTSFPGVKTSRDNFLVDIDKGQLHKRLEQYFSFIVSHEEMRRINADVMTDAARFKASETRDTLRKRGFLPDNIVRYCYRPFDVRWLYWEPETDLLDRKREEYFPQVFENNVWIEARQKQAQNTFDRGYFLRTLADNFGNGLSNFFPLYLRTTEASLLEPAGTKPNLSAVAESYTATIGLAPGDLFYHLLAILHAPAYRDENAGALRQDWPRIPLPGFGKTLADSEKAALRTYLLASAALGRQVAALLDPEAPVAGVSSGAIRPELREVARFSRVDGGQANPAAGDLDLTAGWGYAGRNGITMPGRGRVEMGAAGTLDIYLNEHCCWRGVPEEVWGYTIGGYQVLKKWLSYREKPLLGRALLPDEVRHFSDTARRLAALVALRWELDGNYREGVLE